MQHGYVQVVQFSNGTQFLSALHLVERLHFNAFVGNLAIASDKRAVIYFNDPGTFIKRVDLQNHPIRHRTYRGTHWRVKVNTGVLACSAAAVGTKAPRAIMVRLRGPRLKREK